MNPNEDFEQIELKQEESKVFMGGDRRELETPPEAAISRVRFSPHSNTLLVSSWNSTVSLYDVDENVLRAKFNHPTQALDCCFLDDSSGLSAGADGTLTRYNFITGTEEMLGKHDGLVSCVEFSQSTGQIMTGSWDKTLRFWDARASGEISFNKHVQSDAVDCMSLAGYYLVVASGTVAVNIYDLRNMSGPMQERESPLKYKTECICCYQDEAGYAIGCVEGRIALEFIDLSKTAQENKYAFRCHPKSKGRHYMIAVNAIEFHPTDGRFVTGNNEGYCILWDRKRKTRLHEYAQYPASIASLSYNRDGQLLAVAASYNYREHDKGNETTHIFIENVADTNQFIEP